MIGDKLKERRLELGLTQQQLSQATGIKSTTISNYENNISSPSEENIFKFMEVLKCDANYLFEWNETDDFNITYAEKQSIKKYRALDTHGKTMVDFVLNEEYSRCTTQTTDSVNLSVAAKGGHETTTGNKEDMGKAVKEAFAELNNRIIKK